MSNLRPVICPFHGERPPTLVCKHLVEGKGLGFYTPNRPTSDDGADNDPDDDQAWCSECESVRQQNAGGNDLSEPFAAMTRICDVCFEAARVRNRLGGE